MTPSNSELPQQGATDGKLVTVSSSELLAGRRQVIIQHGPEQPSADQQQQTHPHQIAHPAHSLMIDRASQSATDASQPGMTGQLISWTARHGRHVELWLRF